jgi:hypothetical protein
MTAPVCHVDRSSEREIVTNVPINQLPAIPIARPDLNSLTQAVNSMRSMLLKMTGRDGRSGDGKDNANGFGPNQFKTDPQKRVQWTERARVVEKVRVFQNNDTSSTNWVDVERINKLAMIDKNTGQLWQWDRKRK